VPGKSPASPAGIRAPVNCTIYRCQYETVTENLSGPPRHNPHSLREKFNLFVCQLLLFGVPLLNSVRVSFRVILVLGFDWH